MQFPYCHFRLSVYPIRPGLESAPTWENEEVYQIRRLFIAGGTLKQDSGVHRKRHCRDVLTGKLPNTRALSASHL